VSFSVNNKDHADGPQKKGRGRNVSNYNPPKESSVKEQEIETRTTQERLHHTQEPGTIQNT